VQFKQGHLSFLVHKGDFLYSYRIWMVDNKGVEQIIPTVDAIAASKSLVDTPLGHDYYKEFIRYLFPKRTNEMKCYELYTLHLGIVCAEIVAKNHQQLIAQHWF
jgi:hypothetical protein